VVGPADIFEENILSSFLLQAVAVGCLFPTLLAVFGLDRLLTASFF
jgi:hypothetical protein